jgi:hypothetical protein
MIVNLINMGLSRDLVVVGAIGIKRYIEKLETSQQDVA